MTHVVFLEDVASPAAHAEGAHGVALLPALVERVVHYRLFLHFSHCF